MFQTKTFALYYIVIFTNTHLHTLSHAPHTHCVRIFLLSYLSTSHYFSSRPPDQPCFCLKRLLTRHSDWSCLPQLHLIRLSRVFTSSAYICPPPFSLFKCKLSFQQYHYSSGIRLLGIPKHSIQPLSSF